MTFGWEYPPGAGGSTAYDADAICQDCERVVDVIVRSELGFTETDPEDCPHCGGRLEVQ